MSGLDILVARILKQRAKQNVRKLNNLHPLVLSNKCLYYNHLYSPHNINNSILSSFRTPLPLMYYFVLLLSKTIQFNWGLQSLVVHFSCRRIIIFIFFNFWMDHLMSLPPKANPKTRERERPAKIQHSMNPWRINPQYCKEKDQIAAPNA